ncbi:MAG: hypothetical protein U0229_04725 [Anaeromyxobacter sp.]
MVYKILAAVRTVFLAYLIFYTIKNTPILFGLPDDINEPLRICKNAFSATSSATWMAIGWIGFEVVVGWWLALRKPASASAAPPASPAGAR